MDATIEIEIIQKEIVLDNLCAPGRDPTVKWRSQCVHQIVVFLALHKNVRCILGDHRAVPSS